MSSRVPSYLAHPRWTEVEARAALDARARSGLSLRDFAVREGLDPQRLERWRQRLESGPTTEPTDRATFIELVRPVPTTVEVVLARGRIIRVSESIDPSVLRRIADALDEGAC